jgi:hypothetical protein
MKLFQLKSYTLKLTNNFRSFFLIYLFNFHSVTSLNEILLYQNRSSENDLSTTLSTIVIKTPIITNYTAEDPPELTINNVVNNFIPQPLSFNSSWKGHTNKSFDGISSTGYFPADSSGAIGLQYYVHTVNVKLAIFNRFTEKKLYNQEINSLFQDFGTNCNTVTPSPGCACQVNNNGDAVVVYDKAAKRFLVAQFSITNPDVYGYYYCIAISKTSNPLGSWYRYAFKMDGFFDYGKLVHWNNVYALTGDIFPSNGGHFPQICVFERSNMLLGLSTTFLCYSLPLFQYGASPADNEEINPDPLVYKPIKLINLDTGYSSSSSVYLTEVNYSLNPITISVSVQVLNVKGYTLPCYVDGATCIQQPESIMNLDGLGVYPMFRLVYRHHKKSDVEYMAFNHNVQISLTQIGIAWTIVSRKFNTEDWNIFRSGVHNPDKIDNRWVASMAFDKNFNLGIGYSVSSNITYPSVRVSGRLFNDPDNYLMQEQTIINGYGSQTLFNRWGDYSHMTVDPVDDCTFWYVNMYEKDVNFWCTRITSFVFPSCLNTSEISDIDLITSPITNSPTIFSGSTGVKGLSFNVYLQSLLYLILSIFLSLVVMS